MGIFNSKISINKDNPFEMDKLKREEEAKVLTSLFDIVGNQMVLAINSSWGTGKTTFLKMWKVYLENEGYSAVYFNCWKNDFIDDPFIAFVEEFREQLDSEIIGREFKEKASEVGMCLIKNISGVAMKIVKEKTGLDIEQIISGDDLESMAKSKLDNYTNAKNAVRDFKEELNLLGIRNIEKTNKPLIVFVDELDRCRPNFAIALLERVKHFFNVENIIFILGVDKESLGNSIKVVYGDSTDIDGYLTRFIDMEYTLNQECSKSYINFLMNKYDFNNIFEARKGLEGYSVENSASEFIDLTIDVLNMFKFSLRDIEKVVANLYLVVSINKSKYLYPYALVFLLALKKRNKNLYYKFKYKTIDIDGLVNELDYNTNIVSWLNDYNSKGYIIEAHLIYLLNDNKRIESKKKLIEDKKEKEGSYVYLDVNRYCIDVYEEMGKAYFMSDIDGMQKNIIQKIDMYDNYSI